MTKPLADRIRIIGGELAYAVLAKTQALEAKGKSIVHFEIGQPDFETPQHVKDAAMRALQTGRTKYTPTLGTPDFRKVVAEHISRERKVVVAPEMVAVTPSAKTAIFMAVASVVDPGDEVIYPNPGFPAYENCIKFFGGVPRPLPLLQENHFSFNRATFSSLLSPKTKLIILNSPSNPTGATMPLDDLLFIAAAAKERNLYVVTDEIYSRLLYDGRRYESIYSIPDMQERTMLIDGFSKTYSMTGWRLGYLIAPKAFIPALDNLAVNSYACTATFTQDAGIEALTGSQEEVVAMMKEFEKRRNVIVEGLNSIKGISCATPQGAFYVFPDIQGTGYDDEALAALLLDEAGVAVLPGSAFGEFGKPHIRLSYATALPKIEEGILRMQKAIEGRRTL